MASSLQLDYLQQIRFIVPYGMTPLVVVFSILGLGVEPGLVPLGLDIPHPLRYSGDQTDGHTQHASTPCITSTPHQLGAVHLAYTKGLSHHRV